jgi:hypothetical protein
VSEDGVVVKKAVVPLIVVFLGFWLVSDPRGLADTASDGGGRAWDATGDVFSSAITFFGEL